MMFDCDEEKSKFQLHSDRVLLFLESEREKPDEQKRIYSHQLEALFAVKQYFSEIQIPERPALIVAPTGAGKSGMVALLPYVLASPKVMILSPSLIISTQLEENFGLRNAVVTESFVYKTKMVQEKQLNGFLEKGTRIQVTEVIANMKLYNLVIVNAQKFGTNSSASLNATTKKDDEEEFRQQLRRTKDNFAAFTTLIIDEAHHFPAETWNLICEEFSGKQIIFLTATPFRGSNREPLWKSQQITYRISRKDLIKKKIIRNVIYQSIDCETIQYDAIRAYINNTLSLHDQLEPTVKHKAMILTKKKKEVAKEGAMAMGGDATYYTSDKNTKRNLTDFEKSKYRMIFVCGRLLEGYDNSDVSLCVILRNVEVLGLFTQFVGRCIRVTRNLPNNKTDTVTAVVASIRMFNQEDNFVDYINMD